MSSGRVRFTRAKLALFMALVACLLVGAQLTSALHFVLVPHELCAEHGTFEHTAEHAPRVRHSAPRHGTSIDSSASTSAHEECQLLARRGDRLAVVPRTELAFLRLPLATERRLPPTATAAYCAADLLLIAPKQSPPA